MALGHSLGAALRQLAKVALSNASAGAITCGVTGPAVLAVVKPSAPPHQ
jgi:hypothetical protein